MTDAPLPTPGESGRRTQFNGIALVVTALMAGLLVTLAWKVIAARSNAESLSRASMMFQAEAFQSTVERFLAQTEHDLGELADDPDPSTNRLRQVLLRSPYLSDLAHFDAQGNLLHKGGPRSGGALANARYWIERFQATSSPVLFGLNGDKLEMARAKTNQVTGSREIVVATFANDHIMERLGDVPGLFDLDIFLLNEDKRILIAISQGSVQAPATTPAHILDVLSGSGFGGQGQNFFKDETSLNFVKQLHSFPYRIALTLPLERVFARWRNELYLSLGLAAIVCLAVGLFLAYWRQTDAYQAALVGHLKASRKTLEYAITGANDGIWDWNVASGHVSFSPRMETMAGYAPGEWPPHVETWKQLVHPDDMDQVMRTLSAHLQGETEQYVTEHRLKRKSGDWIWVLDRGKVVERDAAGAPVRAVGTHTDITLQKEITQKLQEAKELAEKASQAKSEFLSSMSHELRTPLNSILGFAQLLEMDPRYPLRSEQRDYVDQIIKGGEHLLELINQVLELSRIEAGKMSLSIEDVRLSEIITEALGLVVTSAQKHDVKLISDPFHFLPYVVRADRIRLTQVLVNLLTNAIKYNRKNGTVTLSVQHGGSGFVEIHVVDTGLGIPADKFELLFKAFERLGRETSAIEGTGIGLTIAKKYMRHMHGEIHAESTPGKGSDFWIEIPRSQKSITSFDSAAPAMLPGTLAARDESRPHVRKRILYVEDNPSNLSLMEQIIRSVLEMEMISAPTAELGIDLAETKQPDLILMDIHLPGMDGVEAFQQLRANEMTRHIPVFAVSAGASPHEINQCLDLGFDDYFTKPIDVERLSGAIRIQLEKSA